MNRTRFLWGGAETIRRHAAGGLGKLLAPKIIADAAALRGAPPQSPDRTEGLEGTLWRTRNVQFRLHTLSVAYALTGARGDLDRLTAELVNCCNFPDWNPYHFLDVSELALAVAAALDWFRDEYPSEVRRSVVNALVEKAFAPSFEMRPAHNYLDRMGYANWLDEPETNRYLINQTGLIAAALAVRDAEPVWSGKILRRAADGLPLAVRLNYPPGGAYSEGPSYWGFASAYMALLLTMLRSEFGNDRGLSELGGVRRTATYFRMMTAPSGLLFDYGDGERVPSDDLFGAPAMAAATDAPALLTTELYGFFRHYANVRDGGIAEMFTRDRTRCPAARLIPLLTLFDLPGTAPEVPETPRVYYGAAGTACRVLALRGANRSYAAMTFAQSFRSHGHGDCGSFIYEFDGLRVFRDNGKENYFLRDSHPGCGPDSDHPLFRVFRAGHNQLLIDGQEPGHLAPGELTALGENAATVDLSAIYPNAETVTRAIELRSDGGLRMLDTVAGAAPGAKIVWHASTEATAIVPDSDGLNLTVTRNLPPRPYGMPEPLAHPPVVLRLRSSIPGAAWKIVPADELRGNDWESPNPGVFVVSISATVPESGFLQIQTEVIPEREQK